MYVTVAEIEEPAMARVLLAALLAHGFHPREGGDSGFPGLAGVYGPRGVPIDLPAAEADDGRVLAEALIKDMRVR